VASCPEKNPENQRLILYYQPGQIRRLSVWGMGSSLSIYIFTISCLTSISEEVMKLYKVEFFQKKFYAIILLSI
jgi:hypothetical protein